MRHRTLLICLFFALGPVLGVRADDAPDSQVNPQTLAIETVSSDWTGSSYDGRFTVDPGSGHPTTSFVFASNASDDLDPRIEISPAGDTWVTWCRETTVDQIRVSKLTLATMTLGADRLVGQPNEAGRNPDIAFDGSHAWVAYELSGSGSKSLAVGIIGDEPDPIPTRTIVGTTTYTGELDVRIHAAAGHLWLTWVDSDSQIGWSEYDSSAQSWSTPEVGSYSGSTVAATREEIRSQVLGN